MAVTSQAYARNPRKRVACPVPFPSVTMCIMPPGPPALLTTAYMITAAQLILAQLAATLQRTSVVPAVLVLTPLNLASPACFVYSPYSRLTLLEKAYASMILIRQRRVTPK